MADVKLRVLGEDEASKILKIIDDNLAKIGKTADKSTEKQKLSLGNLKGTYTDIRNILGDVGRAAQQAYEFIKGGAELELAEMRFDRLATSIGTTADALQNQLAGATSGLLSDADQMKLAGDLMSLGLAKTSEEAVRLTNVAAQLGMNMNQLVLTLTNQTTMRFDALGVAVDGFDDKVKKLEQSGLDTNEAFKMAFIEQAEDQIERVGGVADTTAGQIMILESQWANLVNTVKGGLAKRLGPELTAFNLLNKAYAEGVINLDEYIIALAASQGGTEANANVVDIYTAKLENLATLQGYAAGEAANWDNEQRNLNDTLDFSGSMSNTYADRARNAAQASAEAGSAAAAHNRALQNQKGLLDGVNTSLDNFIDTIREQAEFVESGGKILQDQAEDLRGLYDSGELGFDDLQTGLNLLDMANIDRLMEVGDLTTDEAVAELVELGVPVDEAKLKVAEMQESLFALTAQTYTVRLNVVTSGAIPVPGVTVPGTGGTVGGGPATGGEHGGGGGEVEGASFSSGGGSGDTFIDTMIVVANDPGQFAREMQRNAASAAAGSGNAGVF